MPQFPFLTEARYDRSKQKLKLQDLESGNFHKILSSSFAQDLLGCHVPKNAAPPATPSHQEKWMSDVVQRIDLLLEPHPEQDREVVINDLVIIGIAALHAFLQSNVTGPPLEWSSAELILPQELWDNREELQATRKRLISSLTVDGEVTYQLTPNVELFCLASAILNYHIVVKDNSLTRWARLRANFWHQRMLSESAASLQQKIYDDVDYLDGMIISQNSPYKEEAKVQFLLERAAIHTYHGFDVKARADLDKAAKMTSFAYALTGRLGKRTKFQEKELSQLVVLAKSADTADPPHDTLSSNGYFTSNTEEHASNSEAVAKPKNLDLNDDTLLESISFTKSTSEIDVQTETLPTALVNLDPANQPVLMPLDSIILLSLASSITNTSPQHGLTREETLPYATRVLEGGSTNWQVYTQALLVRSRIEGYRSRTIERGVLQLQALVDQVIAETTSPENPDQLSHAGNSSNGGALNTFLPRPKPSESASVSGRLQYIHQLAPPTRWTLEAELAARWVSLGGLRTALEIYERLEMWAEAALCWAAVDREDKARRIVRRQLYQPSKSVRATSKEEGISGSDDDSEEYLGEELTPPPADAPRLFCILGDIEKSTAFYERAWVVSNNQYARAQRSLGKHYLRIRDFPKAESAYSKSLRINPLDQPTWFSLGCVRLELQDWPGAVDAFGRTVQIEDTDAEAWSNLAAALLRLPSSRSTATEPNDDNLDDHIKPTDPQKHTKEAFVALKRAANLKRESYRIWQNLLNVSATLSPPPYSDIIIAQQRLIELRGSVEGESCIDIEVMEGLLQHVIASTPSPTPHIPEHELPEHEQRRQKFGLEHMFATLLTTHLTPLITHSRRLWLLVARFSLHLNRPSAALDAYEKAWRVTLNKPGWEGGSSVSPVGSGREESPEEVWSEVVDATLELVDAYESLGGRERVEGLAGGGGDLVCKDWKFKARSAIRGVLGRGREAWEGSGGWERLKVRGEELRS